MTPIGNYATGEAALAARIAGLPGFSARSVTRGKWGVLNSGYAPNYAILKPGAGARAFDGMHQVREDWSTVIQVWGRYVDDGTTMESVEAAVSGILDAVDKYPHLGETPNVYIVDSNAAEVGELQEMWKKSGGVSWLRQDVTVKWTGQKLVSILE